jgi:hypothetical protein
MFCPKSNTPLILGSDILEDLEHVVTDLLDSYCGILAAVTAFIPIWANHDVLKNHFICYTATYPLRLCSSDLGLRLLVERSPQEEARCPIDMGDRAANLSDNRPNLDERTAILGLAARTRELTLMLVPFESSLFISDSKNRT